MKGTITNDDGIGLTIADVSIIEGAQDVTSKLQFTVTAFPAPSEQLTADWTTSIEADDTATTDADYTHSSGQVTIAPNGTSDSFEIDIKGDNTPEFDETFTVTLSNPSADGNILANGTAKGTITNDDGTGLRIDTVSVNEGAAWC